MVLALLAVVHVGLAAVWLGSMLYSLMIVQPRAARVLGGDDDRLEEFLTVVGWGAAVQGRRGRRRGTSRGRGPLPRLPGPTTRR